MRYRVAFTKRFESSGREAAQNPTVALDSMLPDGVVAEKVFVERFEPQASHSQGVLDEDDAFLGSSAPEVWEYEIVDERAGEFEDAMRRAGRILEYELVDSIPTYSSEATDEDVTLAEEDAEEERNAAFRTPASAGESDDPTDHGSGVRGGDDGPAGQPTGDPSAGGLSVGNAEVGLDPREASQEDHSGEIDALGVLKSSDPRLGLTNRGLKRTEDWAANTGSSRNPERGVESDGERDYSSTLGPKK